MMLNGEEGLKCEIHVERMQLEYKFKYLGCVLDESGADEAECSRKEGILDESGADEAECMEGGG